MNEGAFGFLDCLGFKGVWRRVDPQQILGFLRDAKSHAAESQVLNAIQESAPNVKSSLAFVSDTVAIGTSFRETPRTDPSMIPVLRGYLVLLTALLAAELSRRFKAAPTPLMFRGCITYGEYLAEDGFLLGPAVDEAASIAEAADGGFVWVTPSAQEFERAHERFERNNARFVYGQLRPDDAVRRVEFVLKNSAQFSDQHPMPEMAKKHYAYWDALDQARKTAVAPIVLNALASLRRDDFLVRDYSMELRDGGRLRVDVVNPLALVNPSAHPTWIADALKGFDQSSLRVAVKKQNTERFLGRASEVSADAHKRLMSALPPVYSEIERVTGVPFRS